VEHGKEDRRTVIKIFISHSSRGRRDRGKPTQAAVIRKAVYRRLKQQYDVFVDSDIRAGEDWERRIQSELAACQAAVVLFDKNALESDRMRDEVAVLMHRRSADHHRLLNPRPPVLGVLIGSVTSRDVKAAGFNGVDNLQYIRVEYPGTRPPEAETAWLIDQVVAKFAVLPRRDELFDEWVRLVAMKLSSTGCDRAVMQAAAKILGLADATGVAVVAGEYLLATSFLAGRGSLEVARAVEEIGRAAQDERNFGKMVHLLMPSWVDAAVVRRALPRPGGFGRFNVVLNLPGEDEELAMDHLRAANLFRVVDGFEIGSATIMPAENAVEELLQGMRDEISKLAKRKNWTQFSQELPLHGNWRFVLVIALSNFPRVSVVLEAVRRLRDDLPEVGILLLTDAGRAVNSPDVVEIGRITLEEISRARDFQARLQAVAEAV
jgi:hypothetical protein